MDLSGDILYIVFERSEISKFTLRAFTKYTQTTFLLIGALIRKPLGMR